MRVWGIDPGVAFLLAYPGYAVNSNGEVLSFWFRNGNKSFMDTTAGPRVLRPVRANKLGHVKVSLGSKNRNVSVHRLVWTAFHGPIPDKAQIRHLDGDPANNRLVNLAIGDQVDNEADKTLHGTRRIHERHHAAKLTEAHVAKARQLRIQGISLQQTIDQLGLDVSKTALSSAIRGRTWS